MKMIGKYSVSSFIKLILDIVLGMFLALTAITLFLFIVSLVNPDFNIGNQKVHLKYGYGFSSSDRITSIDKTFTNPSITISTVLLSYRYRNRLYFFINGLEKLIILGLAIWLIYNLRIVISTLVKREPFIKGNAIRIRNIGIICIIHELIRSFILFNEAWFIKNKFLIFGRPISLKFDLNIETIFLGLVIIVIAEIFRIGTQLKEEQELTI